MHSFQELSENFSQKFNVRHFPVSPASLYEPNEYFLSVSGKRIRPIMCLMGNELFGEIIPDAYEVATAIELFHNFSLVHDDIMDKAPLRRGMPTLHEKYNFSTALLAGDVMLVVAYDYINKIQSRYLGQILRLFNKTAREVCEGQQLDMEYESVESVDLAAYISMIALKTSVLIAGGLRMGAILGGAGEANQQHLYEFGKNLGIAFQIQDDYLDAFGDPEKFGKQVGGDILANKKTFLLIKALESAAPREKQELQHLMKSDVPDKVARVQQIFRHSGVDTWASSLKDQYINSAYKHLEDIAVLSSRKEPLKALAQFLIKRDY
ncbi:MAG: polyprenyl synthetase family protein [Chitinophagaceae bacterium]|nr:MAG: polyprenyl synthetase family protein [Chitinophagaceae bacterium]